jgi:hypothetical protein
MPQDGDSSGIFARMYDALGPLGTEFQVNTTPTGPQQFPDVAAYNNGFVVTWQSGANQDGDGTGMIFLATVLRVWVGRSAGS